MNYYKRHLGDYAKDTGHLTVLEHGVYTLLLDWYYTNERPIPEKLAVRIARGNQEETQAVLSEFFHKTDEGWRHHYADRMIEEYNAKAERNRQVGSLGGRPRKTQTVSEKNPEETQTVSRQNPDVTLANSHKPLAIKEQKQSTDVDSSAAVAADLAGDGEKVPSCPHAEIIELYHQVLPSLACVRTWEGTRVKHMQTRWRSDPARQTLDWWRGFFEFVAESDFLMGRKTDFAANLPWLIKPENFAKVLDGAYHQRVRA